jgi:3-dehydroquinate synthase II
MLKERDVAVQITIQNRDDEKQALTFAKKGVSYLVVECPDWKIIPLENLIAEAGKTKTKLLAVVDNLQEAEVALETLEMGVQGVILETSHIPDIDSAAEIIKQDTGKISLQEAIVDMVKPLGKGARVCVDTCDILTQGEGCLVGSQSSGLFLIEAEVYENPHVEPRPFRVNAGPVSSYTLTPDGKTRYLNELKAGDKILVVDRKGNTKSSLIGRVKIEIRPMILVEGRCDERRYKVILQNAETIRVVTPQGSKSVSEIQPGDKLLIHQEEGGRHFGITVLDEMIIER